MAKTVKLTHDQVSNLKEMLDQALAQSGDWLVALEDAQQFVTTLAEATAEPERVIFRKFPHNCEVIALLPDQYNARTGDIGSYMHNGQHAETAPDFGDTVAADVYDYADLHAELVGQGYTNLKVVKRFGKLGK